MDQSTLERSTPVAVSTSHLDPIHRVVTCSRIGRKVGVGEEVEGMLASPEAGVVVEVERDNTSRESEADVAVVGLTSR